MNGVYIVALKDWVRVARMLIDAECREVYLANLWHGEGIFKVTGLRSDDDDQQTSVFGSAMC